MYLIQIPLYVFIVAIYLLMNGLSKVRVFIMKINKIINIDININNADIKQIRNLHGIGKILAPRIVDNRPYETFDDIRSKVKGIGPKRYSILKKYTKLDTITNVNTPISCVGTSAKKNRNVTEAKKRCIAGKQYYKCANNPFITPRPQRLENYKCPLWEKENENKGSFDQSGFEMDHIHEFSISKNCVKSE